MGEPAAFRSFEADGSAAIRALRLAGAGGALLGAIWLAVAHPTPRGLAGAALGALAALAWLGRAWRSAPGPSRLLLAPRGLTLDVGPERVEIAWEAVRAVEVDEERLAVRIDRQGGPPLLVEPVWQGVGVYALAEAIRRAREEAGRSAG